MKQTRSSLELIKSFVDNTYCRFGQKLLVTKNKFNPNNPSEQSLGFCFKYIDSITNTIIYKIECSEIGIEYTDFRVLMHEYGHVYLGHLDGQQEEADIRVLDTIENYREELVEEINAKCGIDFADSLLNRILDDPELNHSIHNIAMDMSVNSSVLSLEDIDEMEKDISSMLQNPYAEFLQGIKNKIDDEEIRDRLSDEIKRIEAEAKVKLIHPSRYHLIDETTGDQVPFPDGLDYPQYLVLIIQHLDQFVKMLVSIRRGENGDTSQITQQDIQDALNNISDKIEGKSEAYKQGYRDAVNDANKGGNQSQQSQNQQKQQSTENNPSGQPTDQQQQSQQDQDDYNQGYQDALRDMANSVGQDQIGGGGMQGLDDLMQKTGMTSPSSQGQQGQDQDQGNDNNNQSQDQGGGSGKKNNNPHPGMRSDPTKSHYKDHSSKSRENADVARSSGVKRASSYGCGSSGTADGSRYVDKKVDKIDMALQEVLRDMKHRVIKVSYKKDNMKNYNRGIIRSTIAPSISRNVTLCNDPKIVFLIDISGSMDEKIIDRCLSTISSSLKKLSKGLRYDIITWNTSLGEHIKDIDPHKPITKVKSGGGTRIAEGIKYFKDNYKSDAILVIISDFDDYLDEWKAVEDTMSQYSLYGFNYGYSTISEDGWKNLKVRNFNEK